MKEILDHIYEDFKSKVSDGRSLSLEQVEEVAKGITTLHTTTTKLQTQLNSPN
jgi:ClpP class serine protease